MTSRPRMRERILALPRWLRVSAVAIAAFLALCGWAVSSPVGSSPDDDYHLASIWCASPNDDGCRVADDGTYWLPRDLVHASVCYVFVPEQSAACQGEDFGDGPLEYVEWSRGNYDQRLYPALFYAAMSPLASENPQASVYAMRMLNAALFVGTLTALWVLMRPRERDAIAWPLVVTATPLALFIVPSTNPSSWAFLAAYVTLGASAALLEAEGRRRVGLAIVAAASVILGAGARADAAGFALAAVLIAFFVVRPSRSRLVASIWLPALALVAAIVALATSRQSGALTGGLGTDQAERGPLTVVLSMLRNLPLAPDLLQGALGGWGLGWLDTPMPYGVSVVALMVLGALLAAGLKHAPRRRLIAAGVIAVAMTFYPLYLLAQTGAVVGGYFQPRYLFPLLVMLVVVAVMPAGGHRVRASRGQGLVLFFAVTFAAGVSQYALIRRFVTGTDAAYASLDTELEWWAFPMSPTMLWLLTTALTAVVVASLVATVVSRGEVDAAVAEPQSPESARS